MRRSKYRNVRTVVDGINFDSKREAARYQELRLLEKSGLIRELRLQVPYKLTINGVTIGKYVADFCYVEGCIDVQGETKVFVSREVIEDVKGFKTATYRLKKKLMKAIHGIEVRET